MSKSQQVLVQYIMSSKPIHINEDDPLPLIINLMERAHISGAPVTNSKGEYVGVISKTDLAGSKILNLIKEKGSLDQAIGKDVMNPQLPLCINKSFPVEKAVEMMLSKHIHRIFVQDAKGEIIGVVSSFDVMKLIKLQHEEEDTSSKKQNGDRTSKNPNQELRFFSLVTDKQAR